ncbi:MAG: competence protein TfoX [Pseudomonadales bacterium]|nr:competence protein TfoX [Pseudomonadales bacterium]
MHAKHLPLSHLPSLGATSAQLLAEVGIEDVHSLQEHGAVGSFTALRMQFGKRITVNWIYALECAVLGIHWRVLSSERKAELRSIAHQIIADLDRVI